MGHDRSSRQSSGRLRELRDRLAARRSELEQASLARLVAISDPAGVADPSYVIGLRTALTAAIDYGLGTLDPRLGEDAPPVPVALLAQACMAARADVGLETVLRRYAAGHSLLTDAILEEATSLHLSPTLIKSVLRGLGLRYDRIVAAVSEEYEREIAAEPPDGRSALLRRLLDGEPLDTGPLGYPFDGHHVAIVASGHAVAAALPALAERLDRRLLCGEPDPQTTWAWLGGRRPFECEEFDFLAAQAWPEGSAVACGEPGVGLGGWRLSHRQAAAAVPVARRHERPFVFYSDVALLAAVLRDDLLATSLRHAYLDPLRAERDSGVTAKATLRAYFGAAGNLSSAAASLGINRRTVAARLSSVEQRFGRTLDAISTELEVALRLDSVEQSPERTAP